MKRLIPMLLTALGLFLIAGQSLAAEDGDYRSNRRDLAKVTQGEARQTFVNVGQVSMWIFADGTSANTPGGCSGLFFPRGNSPATAAIYQDGFIYGGKVDDGGSQVIRVGGQTYSIGTVPGAILGFRTGQRESLSDHGVNRVWRIRRDYPNADLRLDAAEINEIQSSQVSAGQIAAVREQYRLDWIDWPAHKGAPFYDVDGDGQYTPGFKADGTPKLRPGVGEEFNPDLHADEPGYADADQVVWLVANDLDPGAVQTLYGSVSIGIEMQITLWAYRRSDALGQIVFKQFRLIYKGTATTTPSAKVDSMYFCQWSDPDLGSAGDDFAGCDTSLSLGYAYNATSNDAVYAAVGLPPPASGYDFFAGPLVRTGNPDDEAIFGLQKRSGYVNLPMTTFAYFAAGQADSDPTRGGDYNGTLQWWNLLRAARPRPENPPEPWKDPDGNRTYFRVPGDPVTGEGWIDSTPGDRRLLLASGPFTMALRDTQETVVAALAALGSDRLSSISVLKFVDRFAQDAFDNLFDLPKPQPTPVLTASEFSGQILLNWGEDADAVRLTEQTVDKDYTFEGYNIYQLPNAGATIDQSIKLATFDVPNEVTTITQEIFDPNSGLILNLPVQIGKNSGISRTFTLTTDAFREKPLANGRTYYFGVAAYNFNAGDVTIKSLESPMAVVTVVPQTTKPGERFQAKVGEMLDVDHSTGLSDGTVTPMVVDPSKTTNDTYEVTFRDVEDLSDPDHPTTKTVWDLTNTTSGNVLLAGQENQSGDADYLITEGVQVVVAGPPPGIKPCDAFDCEDPKTWGWDIPAGTRRFTWAGAEGLEFEGFRHALGWASPRSVFGDGVHIVVATALKPVRLILASVTSDGVFDPNDPNVSYGYRHGRGFSAPPALPEFAPYIINTGGSYSYQDFTKSVPLAAFDMSNPDSPRRLAVGFLENNTAGGLVDGKWFPGNSDDFDNTGGAGPREWLWIYDADYSETPNPDWQVEIIAGPQPVMYFSTMQRRGSPVPFSPGGTGEDQFDIFPNIPNSPADRFSFVSKAPTQSADVAKTDAEQLVNVFPNPYYGLNNAELNRFSRYITFSHLPENATVRIFNLAGILVRTLEKADAAQFLQWNLQNERGLPVASGVYIAHVEMPDIGATKVLKLAVIREQEFLRNF